jgi:uncharacterized membrane protein YfcA
MPEYSFTALVYGAAAALLVGLSKTGVPGVSIPSVLLMAEAFAGDEKLSVGAILPILLVADVFAVAFYRQHAEWRRLWGLFPYVAVGMVPGALVLYYISHHQFKLILGWLVLGLLALEIARQVFQWHRLPGRWWFGASLGALAGFGTTVGNAAGPVMSVYFISRGLDKQKFMGTMAWFFFLVNAAKLPFYLPLEMITRETIAFDLWMAPMAVVGALLGRPILSAIPQRIFNPLVLALAGLAALKLVGVPFPFGM